jgi:hypothetical protein
LGCAAEFFRGGLEVLGTGWWVGWDARHQYDRLKLLTNNSRFLILPDWHFTNQEVQHTNEIKTTIPLFDAIDIQGKDVTADALLTQRKIADYLHMTENSCACAFRN